MCGLYPADDTDGTGDTDPVDTGVAFDCADASFFGEQPVWVETGTVIGRVTSPSGEIPVAGSVVSVAVGGETAWVASAEYGCFHLDLPPGDHALAITKGRYSADAAVTLETDEVVDIGEVPLDDGGVRMAVVYGEYDDVGELLAHLGLPIDPFLSPHDLLGDPTLLDEYHVVFANCGSSVTADGDDPYTVEEIDALRAWVEAGGTLYASDWEWSLFAGVAPDAASFDTNPLTGPLGTIDARILDRDIIAVLGKDRADIVYNLPSWAVPNTAGPTGKVLAEGRVAGADRPLAVIAHPGDGRAIFTTFHNEEQVGADMLVVLYQLVLLL